MIRHVISVALIGGLAAGCAHEDKSATVPAAPSKDYAATAPKPAPRAVAPPPVEVASRKPEDAIYFDFDSSLLRDDARPVLQEVGAEAKGGDRSVKVEGNCDEVGTVEYNMALGEARARAAKEYLVHLGVSPGRIAIASFGSQRPKYPGHDEGAHAKNRRDDLVIR